MIEVEKKYIPQIGCTIYVIKGTRIYHREDGPAAEWDNGDKDWYYKGNSINCESKEEFERIIKLLVFA